MCAWHGRYDCYFMLMRANVNEQKRQLQFTRKDADSQMSPFSWKLFSVPVHTFVSKRNLFLPSARNGEKRWKRSSKRNCFQTQSGKFENTIFMKSWTIPSLWLRGAVYRWPLTESVTIDCSCSTWEAERAKMLSKRSCGRKIFDTFS